MRKITRESVDAFVNGRNFKSGNTQVKQIAFESGVPCIIGFYLHGNCIATLHTNERTKSLYVTTCGWKSTTTKERLNGILSAFNLGRIHQKDFVWYLNGEEFNNKIFEL